MTDFRRPDLDLWDEEADDEDARPTLVGPRPTRPLPAGAAEMFDEAAGEATQGAARRELPLSPARPIASGISLPRIQDARILLSRQASHAEARGMNPAETTLVDLEPPFQAYEDDDTRPLPPELPALLARATGLRAATSPERPARAAFSHEVSIAAVLQADAPFASGEGEQVTPVSEAGPPGERPSAAEFEPLRASEVDRLTVRPEDEWGSFVQGLVRHADDDPPLALSAPKRPAPHQPIPRQHTLRGLGAPSEPLLAPSSTEPLSGAERPPAPTEPLPAPAWPLTFDAPLTAGEAAVPQAVTSWPFPASEPAAEEPSLQPFPSAPEPMPAATDMPASEQRGAGAPEDARAAHEPGEEAPVEPAAAASHAVPEGAASIESGIEPAGLGEARQPEVPAQDIRRGTVGEEVHGPSAAVFAAPGRSRDAAPASAAPEPVPTERPVPTEGARSQPAVPVEPIYTRPPMVAPAVARATEGSAAAPRPISSIAPASHTPPRGLEAPEASEEDAVTRVTWWQFAAAVAVMVAVSSFVRSYGRESHELPTAASQPSGADAPVVVATAAEERSVATAPEAVVPEAVVPDLVAPTAAPEPARAPQGATAVTAPAPAEATASRGGPVRGTVPAPVEPSASASVSSSPTWKPREPVPTKAPTSAAQARPSRADARPPSAEPVSAPTAAAPSEATPSPVTRSEPAEGRPASEATAESTRADLPAQPDRATIVATMDALMPSLRACTGGTHGDAELKLTVRSSGAISYALVGGDYAGTPEGSCIAQALRKASFPAFSDPVLRLTYPARF